MENQVLHGYLESIEPYNSSFKKVCIRIFAFGKNANFSNITPQSFELAKNTIFSIPLVAKYIEDTTDDYGLSGNLSGHNTALRQKSDNSWEIYQDTIPLGCIPSDAEIYFEDINEGTEENPDIKTYIVVKGCLLWMRYDAAQKIDEWLNNDIVPKVSMEIGQIQGSLVNNYFQVDNFEFLAICCLGSEKTPCFQSCDISNYTKQDFEKSYSEMLKELKQLTQLELDQKNQLLSPTPDNVDVVDPTNINFQTDSQTNLQTEFNKEGGNINLDKKLELIAKYSNLTDEDLKDINEKLEEYSLEDLEKELKDLDNKKSYETITQENVELKAKNGEFSITIEELNTKITSLESANQDLQSKFSTLETEKIELQTKFEETQTTFEDIQSKFSILETEKAEIESKFSTLESEKVNIEAKCTAFETENNELKTFKETTITTQRKESEDALFEMFSEKLTEDELKPVKDIAMNFSLEQLEEKLYVLVAKKTVKFEHIAKPKVDFTFEKPELNTDTEIKTGRVYDDIVSQYVIK